MGGSEACFCPGWWRQEDASSASRAGLSQSPWLLAEKPKTNMFEGSESKLSASQGYLQRPLHVLGQGAGSSPASCIEPCGRQRGPGWEGISLSLLSFCLQTSSCHNHPPAHQHCCSVPVLSCALWAPPRAPTPPTPLLTAPTRMVWRRPLALVPQAH